MILQVKISAGAKRTQIIGMLGDCLKISVVSAPEKGKANQELIAFLSETFNIPKSAFEIISGETSRCKRILVNDENYGRQIFSGLDKK